MRHKVSIHTRHYWRVKRCAMCAQERCRHRFNPHPPLLAGETAHSVSSAQHTLVSIHTRHYWRVKPVTDALLLMGKLFQSTPAITGG